MDNGHLSASVKTREIYTSVLTNIDARENVHSAHASINQNKWTAQSMVIDSVFQIIETHTDVWFDETKSNTFHACMHDHHNDVLRQPLINYAFIQMSHI